ncbi:MAG: hypothetical protein ABI740_09955 [Alphaproteobacteria bacterium]
MALASTPAPEAHLDFEWIITCVGVALGAGLLGLSIWQDARPKRETIKARWISWRFMMLLAAAILLLALVHVANKLGFHTGRNGPGLN